MDLNKEVERLKRENIQLKTDNNRITEALRVRAKRMQEVSKNDIHYKHWDGEVERAERLIKGCWSRSTDNCDCPACGGYND